ncbi:radical SAM protein [Verrucosispora sp. WMMD573]|uniref:radical SAM/SPASM domain-containing protein n=1 Tax=Verrucosispora sp. WMMD573 TaxID=3015149 RepID=UPI00248B99B2|nr:radical SAM protein [Verrucosispora sp. WMMD573]WBB53246.1 radical SAM protein [Verrucosispora sp. WMMD573]
MTTEQANLRIPGPAEPLSVILKLVGDACNINCYYCYEKRKPYAGYDKLPLDALARLLDLAGGRPLSLELHGGEPLLYGMEATADLLRLLRGYPGNISLSVQTNATMLTPEWFDLFAEEWPEIDIGVSLDGDPEANRNRVDYRDRSTSERVHVALEMAAGRGLAVGLISTVTKDVSRRPEETLDFVAGFDAVKALKFSPCFDFNVMPKRIPVGNRETMLPLLPKGEEHAGWAITPLEFSAFLVRAYDHWRGSGLFRRFLLEPFTSVIRVLAGRDTRFCHFAEQKCAFVLTLYPDGRLGSCDELGVPDGLLGTIHDLPSLDVATSLVTNPTLRGGLDELLDKCVGCGYRSTCGGGCLATRMRYRNSAFYEDYCTHRIEIIDHIAADIARERVASEH